MPLVPKVAAGQIVASSWGNLVVEAVVQRFATAAQRASQLPAPAVNQLTQLDSRPGFLQYWNGTAWVDAAPFVQFGFLSVVTNASGDFTITYPAPFVTSWVPVLQNATAGVSLMFAIGTSAAGSLTARAFRGTDGAAYANQSIQVLWLAVGQRPAPA